MPKNAHKQTKAKNANASGSENKKDENKASKTEEKMDVSSKTKPGKSSNATKTSKALSKAAKAAKGHKKGVHKVKRKLRYTVHFRLKPTLRQPRRPKYARKSMEGKKTMDKYRIVRFPLTTEHAMKRIEDHNTLVFICDPRATKTQIKSAVRQLYNVESVKINTCIRPDGTKKAYVRLAVGQDALDVANKIGII